MKRAKHVEALPKADCCGCTACYAICSKRAITMQRDEQGFRYPQIDDTLCVDCGLCDKVCPKQSTHNVQPLHCYGAKHSNPAEQESSTSGGFAAALSDAILAKGGVVYGVVYRNVKQVVTERIDRSADLYRLKGSKYVQTDPEDTFRQVLQDLKAGLLVAYFSTSCHIDGLTHFLSLRHVDMSNLITVDLICHGVPSPLLFENYIDWLSKHRKVVSYSFRTTSIGGGIAGDPAAAPTIPRFTTPRHARSKKKIWGFGSRTFFPCIFYRRKTACNTPKAKAFLDLFFSNNCLRPHCYACPYAGKGRTADLTIADFWGLKHLHPKEFDERGVSLVLVNSSKGEETFKSLTNIVKFETTYRNACEKQANQHSPSKKAVTYDQFWSDYARHGFTYILRHYTILNPKRLFKYYVKRLLGRE